MKKTGLIFLILMHTACFSQTDENKITVYVFLSETCPICQSYTLKLKELYKNYSDSVSFVGVFPNVYSNEESIKKFNASYQLPFQLQKDTEATLTNKLNASVTPEAFVVDRSGNVLYSGRIDNGFFAPGKKRTVTTSNELEDAIKAIVAGKTLLPAQTKAVGCIITLKE